AALLFFVLTTGAVVSLADQLRIRAALDETEAAKRSAEQTAEIASAAMNDIFENFASTADSISIDFHATHFSAPAVDPKTAGLLQGLLSYYESLGAKTTGDESTSSRRRLGLARMHVGTIHHQLGNHAAAILAFEEAFESLGNEETLLRARILNQIGLAEQLLGRREQAQDLHNDAITLLNTLPETAESRFELARSRILVARRLRPGMGPMSFPPSEAISQNLFFDPAPRELGPGARETGPRGPGFGPSGRRFGPPGERSEFGFGPPGRPPSWPENERTVPPLRERHIDEQLRVAVDDLERLALENPNSMPVKLLLTTAVREALGDGLLARSRRDDERLLELAEQLASDLLLLIALDDRAGENAAVRYELVQLLTDFNVFRELNRKTVDLAIELLDQALPNVEYLNDHHPNVPAYENLLIHTSFKAATVYCIAFDRGPGNPELARRARTLFQQAFQRQLVLMERADEGDGYALWCVLTLMRSGDVQLRIEEAQSAVKSYVQALRLFPMETLNDDEGTPWEIAEALLQRLGRGGPPRQSDWARELARQIAERSDSQSESLREQLIRFRNESRM
ncbi:MAG: hypothetical protein AAFX06_15270, partial [Planctomycetota bacterium]